MYSLNKLQYYRNIYHILLVINEFTKYLLIYFCCPLEFNNLSHFRVSHNDSKSSTLKINLIRNSKCL